MTGTTPAPAAQPVPSNADAPLTFDEERSILQELEPKLFSLERLGRAVSLAANGLGNINSCDDAYAVGELGEQIEALAKEIREKSYAWCRSADAEDDGEDDVEEADGAA